MLEAAAHKVGCDERGEDEEEAPEFKKRKKLNNRELKEAKEARAQAVKQLTSDLFTPSMQAGPKPKRACRQGASNESVPSRHEVFAYFYCPADADGRASAKEKWEAAGHGALFATFHPPKLRNNFKVKM